MMDVDVSELKKAVEGQHGCRAVFVQSVPVKERFMSQAVWEGVVHIFELIGHPKAKQAYDWSSPRGKQ